MCLESSICKFKMCIHVHVITNMYIQNIYTCTSNYLQFSLKDNQTPQVVFNTHIQWKYTYSINSRY